MDHKFEVMAEAVPMKLKPSEYFDRQCLISLDPDEGMNRQIVEHVEPEYVTWVSDYPHIDASMGVVK